MGIALMPHIPHDLIVRRIEYPVQGDGKLNNTEIGCKMPAVFRNGVDQFIAYFIGKHGQISLGYFFYVLRRIDPGQIFIFHGFFLSDQCSLFKSISAIILISSAFSPKMLSAATAFCVYSSASSAAFSSPNTLT